MKKNDNEVQNETKSLFDLTKMFEHNKKKIEHLQKKIDSLNETQQKIAEEIKNSVNNI